MKKYAIIFCLILPLVISCKKLKKLGVAPPLAKLFFDDDKLPIIVNNGENYFGYIIDGNSVWEQKKSVLDSKVKAKYNTIEKSLYLSFASERSSVFIDLKSVDLRVGETYQLKDVLLNPQPSSHAAYYEKGTPITSSNGNEIGTIITLNTSNDIPNHVKITHLNWETKIIAGEFDLTVQDLSKMNKKRITKGRFDVKF